MLTIVLGAVAAVATVVAAVLRKSGKDKAADVLDGVLVVLRKLLEVLRNTNDPAVKASVLGQIRAQLLVLDKLNIPAAKKAAAQIRAEVG